MKESFNNFLFLYIHINKFLVNNKNMNDNELLKLWRSGLDKFQLAKIYKREYNERIKFIRLNPKHRYERFLTNYEALKYVEELLLKNINNI